MKLVVSAPKGQSIYTIAYGGVPEGHKFPSSGGVPEGRGGLFIRETLKAQETTPSFCCAKCHPSGGGEFRTFAAQK